MQYLDKSDTRLQLSLQVTNTGMWEWNILAGEVAWSENIEQLFGLVPGTFTGTYRGLLKRILPADRRSVTQAIARALKKPADYTIEFRICCPDGSIRWLSSFARVYYDERSHPVKMTGLCRDITVGKQAEVAQKPENAHSFALSDLTLNAIASVRQSVAQPDATVSFLRLSQEGIFLDVRPGKDVEVLMAPAEWIGKSVSAVMPPEMAQQLQHYLAEALTTNQTQIFEYSLLLKGKPQYFQARLVSCGNREVLAIVRHITEQQHLPAAPSLSEQHLHSLLNSLEDVVWSASFDNFELLYLNPAAEIIYGRPSSEFFEKPNLWLETIHPEDRDQVWIETRKLVETGSRDREYRIVCPNGEIRWLRDRTRLILDANGNPSRLDGIAIDITQTKQLIAELQQANETLKLRLQEQTAALEQAVAQLNSKIEVELVSAIPHDVTPHEQTKAALARSEAKWRSLIQNSSDLITILSKKGIILYKSPSIQNILGYSPEELVGQPVLNYIAPDDQQTIKKAMKKLLVAGHSVTLPPIVFRFLCKDGTWRFLEASGTNLLANEAVGGIVINSRDVTDRFKVQEALRQSEVRFRAIFEGAALGIALSDPTGVLLTTNPALQRMLGYSDIELRNRTITHPDDVAADANLYQELLAGSLPSYQLEKRYFHKDGKLVWGRLTVSLARDKAGKPLFVVAMVEDITAAKQTEAALLRISKAVENASDAISITDTLGSKLIYLNPAFCQMFEYTLEQLNAAGGVFILFPDPKIMHEVFAIAVSGYSWQGEVEMLSRNGVLKQIALRADAIKDVTGEVVGTIAIHTDITERKQAEAALRRSYDRAELLKQITTEIRSSLDLQHIFQTTVTQLGKALQVNRCMIHLYQDSQPPKLPLVAEYLEPGYSSLQHFEVPVKGNPHVERVLATDQAIASTNVYTDPLLETTAHLCREMDIKSLLSIRTSYQGEPNGVLGLHQCDSSRDWNSSEIELLEAVAAQVGIALAQAHLLEKQTCTAAKLTEQNLALQLSEARANTKATELEQALRELQRTQAQLVQTEKMSSLGHLVAGVAHEINNPVSFITGNINYACDYIEDLLGVVNLYRQYYPHPAEEIQEEVKEIDLEFLIKDFPKLLTSMKVGADRINQIVLSLRNFSRNDDGEMKSVDIHEGINNTLMILQNRLKAQGGSPEIKVIKEYGTLPLVECYAGQLNQVFMNLISNAIDALEEGRCKNQTPLPQQGSSSPYIQISTEAKGDNRAVIRITDNGGGMTEEVQQKLFNPFFTTKPMGKGTGLGLSISYQIVVEKHRGELHCFSTPGQGTQFIIEIPIRHDHLP